MFQSAPFHVMIATVLTPQTESSYLSPFGHTARWSNFSRSLTMIFQRMMVTHKRPSPADFKTLQIQSAQLSPFSHCAGWSNFSRSFTLIFQVMTMTHKWPYFKLPLMQASKLRKSSHHTCHRLATVLGGIIFPGRHLNFPGDDSDKRMTVLQVALDVGYQTAQTEASYQSSFGHSSRWSIFSRSLTLIFQVMIVIHNQPYLRLRFMKATKQRKPNHLIGHRSVTFLGGVTFPGR